MRIKRVELSSDAFALIKVAVLGERSTAQEQLAVCLSFEGPDAASDQFSEAFQAGVRLKSLENLIEVLDAAVAIHVWLPV